MLRRFWRWLTSLVGRWWGGRRRPQPPPPPEINPFSDAKYERFFLGLLDGVAQGWDSGRVLEYLGERVDDRFFHSWLMRFGRDRVLPSPRPQRELASRMVRLGELGCGRVGELAGQYGGQKLAQPLSPLTAAQFKSLFPELLRQRDGGLEAVREWLQGWEAQAREEDWLDWLERAGEDWLVNPPEARFVGAMLEFAELGEFPLAQGVGDWGRRLQERLRGSSLPPSPSGIGEGISLGRPPGGSQEYWIENPGAATLFLRTVELSGAGNYEAALRLLNEALESFLDELLLWELHGEVLDDLGRYEEAVASFDRALELNPKFAMAWSRRGNALYDLGRHEEALASHDRALELNPKDANAWVNRGAAAGQSRGCFYSVRLTLPPHLQNPALDQRGYEGRLASFEEGLKHCPPERDPEGAGWLNYAIGNTHYSRGRQDANPYPFWRKAANGYNAALNSLSETHSPERRLKALRDLGRVLFELGQTEEAAEVRRQGADLLRRLLQQTSSPGKQRQLSLEFISLQQLTVDLECQAGHSQAALMLAERGKNSCLRWLLSGGTEEIPSPDFPSLQRYLCPEKTAAVYWHISPAALTLFLLKPNQDPIPILAAEERDGRLPRLRQLLEWEEWVETWTQDYQDYRSGKSKSGSANRDHPWRRNMDSRLQRLGEILRIEALLGELADEEIDHLILLPHRDLHLLPLEALFPSHYRLSRLPSAQVGMTLAQQPLPPITSETPLLLVGYPESQDLPPLEFAQLETESLGLRFQRVQSRCGEQVRQDSLSKELRQGDYRLMHFTGHGGYDFHAPERSWLALSGGEFLRVEELLDLPLSGYRLVSLAACETAMAGQKSITTDYVGLSSGWLVAGVSLLLSTLWTVESAASMLLTLRFYDQVLAGVPEPQALAEAKGWLSTCDVGGLREFYEGELRRYEADDDPVRPFLLDQLDSLEGQDPSAQLYRHPYYWAAFTLTGDITS